jgi:hypothetical protein
MIQQLSNASSYVEGCPTIMISKIYTTTMTEQLSNNLYLAFSSCYTGRCPTIMICKIHTSAMIQQLSNNFRMACSSYAERCPNNDLQNPH